MKPAPPELHRRFPPSPDLLLRTLLMRIDGSMLREIAAADYGSDLEEHLAGLRAICRRGEAPSPLELHPKEVLELIRWSEPEDSTWHPGGTGTRGHLMRAFACAVLLQAAADPKTVDRILSENETIAQLLASARALGPDIGEAVARALLWRVDQFAAEEDEAPFFAFALLLLWAWLAKDAASAACLPRIADWVELAEEHERTRQQGGARQEWLLGLTCFTQKREVWRRLARELLLDASSQWSAETRNRLAGMAIRLGGKQ